MTGIFGDDKEYRQTTLTQPQTWRGARGDLVSTMSQTSEKSDKDYVSETEYQARPSAMSILAMVGATAEVLSESAEVLSDSETDSNESDATP